MGVETSIQQPWISIMSSSGSSPGSLLKKRETSLPEELHSTDTGPDYTQLPRTDGFEASPGSQTCRRDEGTGPPGPAPSRCLLDNLHIQKMEEYLNTCRVMSKYLKDILKMHTVLISHG